MRAELSAGPLPEPEDLPKPLARSAAAASRASPPRALPAFVLLGLLLTLLLRLGLLVGHFADQDEINTVWIALAPDLADGLARVRYDGNPPLYYALAALWLALLPGGLVELRWLSLLLAGATALLLYRLGSELRGPALGLTALLLLAVSPFHVGFSALARPYALAVLLAAWSAYWTARVTRDGGRWSWAALTLGNVALAYTHYYGLFFLAGEALYLLVALGRRRGWRAGLRGALLAGGGPALSLAPWLLDALPLQVRVTAAIWVGQGRWPDPLGVLANLAVALTVGLAVDGQLGAGLTGLVGALVVLAALGWRRRLDLPPLILIGLGPVVLGALVVLAAPLYAARYFAVVLPLVVLGLAALVVGPPQGHPNAPEGAFGTPQPERALLGATLVLVGLYGTTRVWWAYHTLPGVPPERYALYDELGWLAAPNDRIAFTAAWQWSELRALHPALAGQLVLVRAERDVDALLAAGRPVWWVGSADDAHVWRPLFERLTARASRDQTLDFSAHPPRAWVEHLTPPPGGAVRWEPSDAEFAGRLGVTALAQPAGPLRPRDALQLGIELLPAAPIAADYTLFVQLLDAQGRLAVGFDAPPEPPTSAWSPGERRVLWRSLWLPPDLPPGRYRLIIGWYPSGSNGAPRLPLADGRDALAVGAVEVLPGDPRPRPARGQSSGSAAGLRWDHDWTFANRLPWQ